MRIRLYIIFASCALLSLVASFTKDDYEIFRLRDELEATDGKEVTFYGEPRSMIDISNR